MGQAPSDAFPPLCRSAEKPCQRQQTDHRGKGASDRISAVQGIELRDGLAAARETGKPVFLDFTGYGCVNCREMEARVWSDPEVLRRLREDFIIVALHVDDKTKLPESKWVVTDKGKTLKDIGRVNSYIALHDFGVNAQPNYFLLDGDGRRLAGPRPYNLDIQGFVDFLDSAL